MKFSILTLGCKTNQAESEYLSIELLKKGYKEVDLSGAPDICIINTCTVTSKSDYQSRQLIRRALRTGAKVIVTGCYVNRAQEEIKKIAGNCFIFKNEEKANIINMFDFIMSSNTLDLSFHRSRPAIKIQDGCNKRCSYCIIPQVRGRSRSREIDDIVREVKGLEEHGYSEVVLTGINIGSYGVDLVPKKRLEDLLEGIISETNKIRIRLSSLGIKEVSRKIIDLMKTSGRICRHLHLSLQSGDNTILKLMNRSYRREDFIDLAVSLKENLMDINIGADVIVGFPGETEEHFMNTCDAIEKAGIGYLHIFPYSKRPGTPAATMPNQVNSRVKSSRLKVLKDIDQRLRNSFYHAQVGKVYQIVIEEIEDGFIRGKTDNYLDVYVAFRSFKGNVKKAESMKITIKDLDQKGLIAEPL